jgi:3-oxoacid CoA-transferase subunit A
VVATAGRVTVAEVQVLERDCYLHPDEVHTPGIFIDHLGHAAARGEIEHRTTRPRQNERSGVDVDA